MGNISQVSKPELESSAIRDKKFPALLRRQGLAATNLGGKFSLPPEFDATRYASALVTEGNEVLAMQAPQTVMGTDYIADGWNIWKYPNTYKRTVDGKEVEEKHPMAGQQHKVTGLKPGENYVLMFRPIEISEQVNQAYGELSIRQMEREISGETLSVTDQEGNVIVDPGMLTEERLRKEIGADVERDEAFGRSAAVHGMPGSRRIKSEAQSVSR